MKKRKRQQAKKQWKVTRTYEPNRLSGLFLAQAYERLAPVSVHVSAKKLDFSDRSKSKSKS